MRNILTLSIFIFSLSICAQETNNFSIDNGGVVWQKVYETDLSFDELTNKIKELGSLTDIEIAENKLIGQTRKVEGDVKGAGFKVMSAPIYMGRYFYDGFALIEFRDGRYRVTLRNIILTQKYDDPLGKTGDKDNIELYAISKGELNKTFVKYGEILNFSFNKLFEIPTSSLSDEW